MTGQAVDIFEKLNSIVLLVNPDGKIEYANSFTQKSLGYHSSDLLGEKWWKTTNYSEIQEMESKRFILKIINDEVRTDELVYERKLSTKQGGKKWILWSASKTESGKVLVIGNDITRQKESELELKKSNEALHEKNQDLTQSVEYAQKIQEAILPKTHKIKSVLDDFFVMYKPKDLVSGDFYFYHNDKKGKVYLAVMDCTGHGVPGAMLTVLANSILRDIVIKKKITEPAVVLEALDYEIQTAFRDEDGYNLAKDGLDIAFIRMDQTKNELCFSGAFRPLIEVKSNGELIEYGGGRFPIGFFDDRVKNFEQVCLPLEGTSSFYMFSDGYIDQFGGENNKKFNKKKFKELLVSVQDMKMEDQEHFLEYAFNNWKQQEVQTDDICVLGFKG
ncbi:MAG: SpoIIE family protein phosphatase [Crocinitomicaceae bacterium]|nr:SpoIIE family protein phosphatase [Crocinitomicaceae bacterium]